MQSKKTYDDTSCTKKQATATSIQGIQAKALSYTQDQVYI